MARSATKSATKSGTKRKAARRAPKPARARGWLGRMALAAVVVFAAYAVWLDFTVRARFEGATWALPARIYARPLDLFPGQSLTAAGLVAELDAAGYHPVGRISRPGSYARNGGQFEIATREFQFWDGTEPARHLRLRVNDGRVLGLSENGSAAPLARLDPALIGRIYPGHREDRILVKREEVPAALIAGLLAVEDRGFYEHHGISVRGIARAMWANVRAGGAVQGGSTLTQQLAKNLYLSSERRLWRKVNEAFMALVLEARYSKGALLEAYLNEVYLGQEGSRAIHGFGSAAWFYFGRRLDELDPKESALLIAMVRGASVYNPRRQPERALRRRNLVLDIMARQGVISRGEAAGAKHSALGILAAAPKGRSPHPAFIDLVRAQLARDYRESDLRSEGLKIFTSLEPLAQVRAERALAERLGGLERRVRLPRRTLQGAVVLVRPASGEVVALVGDRNPRAVGFNRAVNALRPIGSLVKPAVYLAALAGPKGHHLMSPLADTPLTIRSKRQPPWSPQNYDRGFAGELPLMSALARSTNVATVRLGLEVGLGEVVEVLRSLGVDRRIPELPSLLLGSVALTPLEVAQVYQTLANDGFQAPLRAIREVTDKSGSPLSRYGLHVRNAAPADSVYLVRHALELAITEGTGRGALGSIGPHQRFAGKTGTTDELRDSWFAGFNNELLGVVWVGRDDNKPAGLTGASGALQVWARIVPPLAQPVTDALSAPPGIEWHWSSLDGRSVTEPECPAAVQIPFRRGTAPGFEPCAALSGRSTGATRGAPERRWNLDDGAG